VFSNQAKIYCVYNIMANGEKRIVVMTLILFTILLLYTLWMILRISKEGENSDQSDKKTKKNMKVDLTPIDVPPSQ
jgi:uncharacterized membrane protein